MVVMGYRVPRAIETFHGTKDYAKPFKLDGRKIVLLGAIFASDMSALDGVLVEEG